MRTPKPPQRKLQRWRLAPIQRSRRDRDNEAVLSRAVHPEWRTGGAVGRKTLRERIWPRSGQAIAVQAFREQELRRQLLASAARLGHAFIDLYVMTIGRLGSLELRALDLQDGDGREGATDRIDDYLDMLEREMNIPLEERDWGAFDELAAIAENFELLLDVNEPDARSKPLAETARVFGQLLRQQQPTGGMSGQLNQTLVRQFRMPGYPLVLVTTDLLQEGEDLHTFCSEVHHYGIAWTPSSMEQRIGRIDRVRSHTERRLGGLRTPTIRGEDMLQVYFPHLEDSVEILQVDRVLARMNEFLRLMHEGLVVPTANGRSINTTKEIVRGRQRVEPIRERLKTAFPVRPEHTKGDDRPLAVTAADADALRARFARIASQPLPGLTVEWEPQAEPGVLHGTACLGARIQPLTLLLRSFEAYPAVRCISPVGCVHQRVEHRRIVASAARGSARIGAILTAKSRTYDLTVEDEMLLTVNEGVDATRVAALARRVVTLADALEQEHLPGRDEELATFRAELDQEALRGR